MKNASKYAEELKSLLKKLLKDAKPEPLVPIDPLRALVRASVLHDVPDAKADEAMKVVDKEFVDLNELRVATELEVQDMLGERYPSIEGRVAMITQCLSEIFEREGVLSLNRLKDIGRKEARQFLRELPGVSPFVEGYVLLFGFEGHAVPLDTTMQEYLVEHEALPADLPIDEAQKFLENHLKADEMYEAFVVIRNAALENKKKKKK